MSRYFPPEIGTAANLFFELARGLTHNGHRVTVVTNFPWYNLKEIPQRYKGKFFMREKLDGFYVLRLALPVFGPQKLKLAAGHLTVPLTSAISALFSDTPDIVYIYSPPLPMGINGWLLKVFKNVPFIMGVQDLHPQCYIDQEILKNTLVIWMFEALEKFCYRQSSVITVHSDGNKEHIVRQKGTPGKKVHVLPNWIDTEELQPLPRENPFSKEYDLNGKFVVGYAGTLGISQGLMSVVEAAAILRDRKGIEFFIVGDGIEKEPMVARAKELRLDNIRFLPMQTKSVYPLVVASCDVGLVTLNARVKTPVVPSKILSLMAARKPVLASLPLDGDAPRLIQGAGCGICIGPEDPEGLAMEIMRLAEDPDLCRKFGEQGREYVVREMSLDKVVRDLEKLFEQVIHNYRKKRGI